jgi:hypothetical protein
MILESDHRPKRRGEPMSTVVCSPISHRKLDKYKIGECKLWFHS